MKKILYSRLRTNALQLPALPTPQLSHTFDQYAKSVRPMKRGAGVDTHFERLERFKNGSAADLQATLEAMSLKSIGDANGIISWGKWRDDGILRQRTPLPIYSNMAVGVKKLGAVDASAFDSHVVLKKVSQPELAGQIVHSLTRFVRSAISDGIAVDQEDCDVSNIVDQFCSARIPQSVKDAIFRGDWEKDSSQIVVLRDGHIYFLRVVCEKTGKIIDAESLSAAIDHILDITPLDNNPCPVSALTSLPREEAASAFQLLCKESPSNAEALKKIDRAIAVLCLDTEVWSSPEVKQQFMLFGSGAEAESRWYHKTQIIVSADGEVAVNFERALADNHASRVWYNAVFNDVQYKLLEGHAERSQFAPLPTLSEVSAEPATLVKPLEVVFGKGFAANIRSAKESARHLSDSVSVDYVRIPIPTTLDMHPDAFMQTCFQLAYYILHSRSAPTTQEICLSSFFNGGMAYIRTGMPIVRPFLELWSQREKNQSSVTDGEMRNALTAINAHYLSKLVEVSKGKGVGEHLDALEHVACVQEVRNPKYADAREFFADPLFKAWDTPLLATGSISAPFVDSYSIGPQTPDGFGLGYVVHPSYVIVNITCFHGDKISDFRDSIGKAAKILIEILEKKN